jgi:TolB-like protein
VSAKGKLFCQVCGTALSGAGEACPVCALRGALWPETTALLDSSSKLRFEHYQVLKNKDGTFIELGRGAMGLTYKALDVHLQCPVALKIINARFIGDDSARRRFVREARAAASVRHPNVASVFHLGESSGNYFYAMEFVDGETLGKLIQRSGRLEPDLALEIVAQVAAGLVAIEKKLLVHRDIKASNIMLSWDDGRLETVKIIDLGLAKGVGEETISTAGGFLGTPGYASPEQFAGIGIDIRSDLYSLGVTLWEMVSGKLPFQGSAVELMDQHQHSALPIEKLKSVPAPIIVLLEILLAKDPGQRFQNPAQLQKALPKVREALASGSRLTANDLCSITDRAIEQTVKRKSKKQVVRWVLAAGLCLAGVLVTWFFFSGHGTLFFNQRVSETTLSQRSIAVLPFESLSENKSDTYFADGVQDEILNNLAKIAQHKVISRISVMQYRADTKRDLHEIANTLGVANVLEGAVRRNGDRVRVSTELIDARSDNTIWADSYDRDLTDIFAIQSEIAQTIARKLAATLSPEEKKRIEQKPTQNLEAYDLYLRSKELVRDALVIAIVGDLGESLHEAVQLLEQAVHLDPSFTLAYSVSTEAHDILYQLVDPSPERRALADASITKALSLQPDLPEVRLAYAHYLYFVYRDYEQARIQLAMARAGLPNSAEARLIAAFMDRRQGNFDKAIQMFNEAIALDPRNTFSITELSNTLGMTKQFRAAHQVFRRLIEFFPNEPMLQVEEALSVASETGDPTALRSALKVIPESIANDSEALFARLYLALTDRDWAAAKVIIQKMKEKGADIFFAYGAGPPVPVGCYDILLARLQDEQFDTSSAFTDTREQLRQRVQKLSGHGRLLSQLAVVDALLNNKAAIPEAKRAVEMLPIFKDAIEGPAVLLNLAVAYAWTGELDLAFATLELIKTTPGGPDYGMLKREPFWDPLRKDPRFDKLLAELAPKD